MPRRPLFDETCSAERWQEPQNSCESPSGSIEPGLKMRLFLKSFASIAATCSAPGPWQASQLTPGIKRSSCNCVPAVEAVEWHEKQLRASSALTARPAASFRVGGGSRV